MTHYVCGFVVTDNGYITLIKKNKPEWQKGKYNGLGGKLEAGETLHGAMRREFLEEAGKDVANWEHRVSLVGKDFTVNFFIAFDKEPFPLAECEEGDIIWANLSTVGSLVNLIPNLKWIIPFCVQKQFLSIEVQDQN